MSETDSQQILAALRKAGLVGAAVLLVAVMLLGGAFASGQMNMADVYARVPRPVAAWMVDNPDETMRLQCDGVDERDPQAIQALAAKHGLTVVYEPPGAEVGALVRVDWLYWRDKLVATVASPDDELPRHDDRISGGCPG